MMHPDNLAELARQRHDELLRIAERSHIARVAKAQRHTGRPWLESVLRRLRGLIHATAPSADRRGDRPASGQTVVDLRGAPGVHRAAETVGAQATGVAARSHDR
jgi:hypothetical protein